LPCSWRLRSNLHRRRDETKGALKEILEEE
jgi:hypothetical protein